LSREPDTTGLRPVAAATGPFARPAFLLEVMGAAPQGEVRQLLSSDGWMTMEVGESVVSMGGHADLCDYHTPLGSGAMELMAGFAGELGRGYRIDLDSLPLEAAEVLSKGLAVAGFDPEIGEHSETLVLSLPATFEEYLGLLGKKQRHELRRKVRRFEEHLGPVEFETHRSGGWALSEFVRLHRLAGGEKAGFMTAAIEGFFARLLAQPGWQIDLLRLPGTERAAACLFAYVDDEGYFLYNSSFDPDLGDSSPGNVLLAEAIETSIRAGLPRFDFLKGTEEYKFRLGATRRPLYRVKVAT
jgi:CelD/BcsL family acetyltransferase involved in cellulose biosynthesis